MAQPKILYKYLQKEYAHLLITKGIIRLGTLFEYRDIEKHGQIIGDDAEGKKSSTMPIGDEAWTRQHHPDFAENFFNFSGNGRLRIGNLTLKAQQQSVDYFLFCTTETYDRNALEDFGYDACIVIHEPIKFFLIINDIIKADAEYQGYFRCVYISRELPHQIYNKIHPALIKDPKYKNQKEVRALWKPRNHPIEPRIITCPKAIQYCSTRI